MVMQNIPFRCPKCGGNSFVISKYAKKMEIYCITKQNNCICGWTLSKEETQGFLNIYPELISNYRKVYKRMYMKRYMQLYRQETR